MRPRLKRPLSPVEAAAYGLALCYLVNDTEELLTYVESSRWAAGLLPGRRTAPQEARAGARGVSQTHVAIGVPLIGIYWVGAALDGRRTGGRSAFFQDALWAWGVHGFAHLGLSVLRRGYTSGVATAPLVIGYWVWAERVLRVAGVPRTSSPPRAVAKGLAALVATHGLAALAERALRSGGQGAARSGAAPAQGARVRVRAAARSRR